MDCESSYGAGRALGVCLGCRGHRELVIWGVDGVAVARHGPILNDNEAMGSGKTFKYLRGLRDTIQNSKMAAKVPKTQNPVFYRIFQYQIPSLLSAHAGIYIFWPISLYRGRRHGRSPYYNRCIGKQ